jgi:hypothetical protein
MNANELADELHKHLYNDNGKEFTLEKAIASAATMLRQQQAEIEALKDRFSLAYWHDTFVEVKKPNSDLIYRFKLEE